MSLKRVNPEQPKTFEFSEKFKNIAEEILKKYPKKNFDFNKINKEKENP